MAYILKQHKTSEQDLVADARRLGCSQRGASTDRAMYEHGVLSTALDAAIQHDQLNVVNCVAMEVSVTSRMVIEDACAGNPENPKYVGRST